VGRLGRALALALALAGLAHGPARAQALDPAAAGALEATLRMLLDPAARAAALAGNPQAGPIDQQVRALTGSEALTQELYALAADVFRELAQSTGGDPARMTELLDRGRTDPAAFAAGLSPQTLERLRALSIRIGDQRR
jgi:hypothetical protein